jgi:hypothetical protein
VTTTYELWDYGVLVEVERPPDDDTCPFLEFFSETMSAFD